MELDFFHIILIIAVSYVLGSLPSAYVAGKINKINIFEVGSGNMGGTNVVRAVGWGWGVLVGVCDCFKGMLAILVARALLPDHQALATTIAAVVAIVGHNWSLFASVLTGTIRGGKGAATTFGTLLMIAPAQVILGTLFLFGLIVAITRYVSLGVLVMFTIGMVWLLILVSEKQLDQVFIAYSFCVVALMLVRFRGNIQRLLEGRERRLGERA